MATQDLCKLALNKAKEGHSFIITGQCGTGKTYLLKEIVKELGTTCKVAVTATTGMASSQLHATTLHHWAGIMDGRHSNEKLGELFDGDDQFSSARGRILETDCLVIDEISMLSAKVFNMVEFVVRHVKQNKKIFGGIQIIGSGDFKQLPPVPNHRYDDDGSFCFESHLFQRVFPHHVNLQKVVRQSETSLVTAVNQLCNGIPSEETIHLLKSLERPLDVPSHQITRLFGTNFDAQYVNHEMLEEIDEELFVYKAKDEGKLNMLRNSHVPRTLMLKKGAKVILVKNIGPGLYNGMQGTVHELRKESPPVINFGGKLVPLTAVRFDVFDTSQQRSIACRVQLPVILSFALTVHRAQGQTLQFVEIDCFSFFAPGQMGVAVGRATTTKGLRILNFNSEAANRKHPECVYTFYNNVFSDFQPDLLCCKKTTVSSVECDQVPVISTPGPSADGAPSTEHYDDCTNDDVNQGVFDTTDDVPRLESPWNIDEFCAEHTSASFLTDLPLDLFQSDRFLNHLNFLYYNVNKIVCQHLKSSHQWINAYGELNTFLVSDLHLASIASLFQVKTVNKCQNKLSSKLVFWLMDKEINKKATVFTEKQSEKTQERLADAELTSASKAKLRYLAGACVQKLTKRLKESVLRKMGQSTKKSKICKKMDYKKQHMLKQFRINESEISETDESMNEIEFKQGQGRGLTIVNYSVFEFFISLNSVVQRRLSKEQIHLHFDKLHHMCRLCVDTDDDLVMKWVSLFDEQHDEEIEDEIFLILIMELFRDITEHFIRIAFVDSFSNFKRSVPRKKKQALRTKIQALGERKCSISKKRVLDDSESQEVSESHIYICTTCNSECEWEPAEIEKESIACDKCNLWFHYKCVNIKGNESFLKKETSTWLCPKCSRKGKGRGKSSTRK